MHTTFSIVPIEAICSYTHDVPGLCTDLESDSLVCYPTGQLCRVPLWMRVHVLGVGRSHGCTSIDISSSYLQSADVVDSKYPYISYR